MTSFLVGLGLGVVFSLLGAGGGILTVPILLEGFHLPLAQATAGALAVVWAASVFGTLGHARGKRVLWKAVLWFGGPSMLGAVAGAKLNPLVPERVTLVLFSTVLLAATAFMFRKKREAAAEPRLDPRFLVPAGLVLGVATGFLGVGGGFLIVPVLVGAAHLPLKQAVGTSMAIIAASSFSGAATYVLAGEAPMHLVLPMGGGAILGALVGAPLAGKLPERPLRLGFAALAVGIALLVLRRAWVG